MPARALIGVAIASVVASCTLVPGSYGEPPSECRGLAAGTQLLWAGHGDPADFGLVERSTADAPPGDIYVGFAEADPAAPTRPGGGMPGRLFCVIIPPGHPSGSTMYMYPVPAGWEPPPP